MKLMKSLWLALLCLAATSCSLLDDLDPQPDGNNTGQTRISSTRYYFSDKSFSQIKYSYNSSGQLIKKNWYNQKNELDFYEEFIYEQKLLTRIKRSSDKGEIAEARFTYNNGLTQTMEYWMTDTNSKLAKVYTTVYEYSGNLITKSTSTYYNGAASYYTLYTYANGNIVSVKGYDLATQALLEEDTYTYDNKANPFYKLTNQYHGHPVASSKNNVIHYKIVSYKHVPQNPELSFEYTYNDKGFPIEKYIVGKDGKRYLDESFFYTN